MYNLFNAYGSNSDLMSRKNDVVTGFMQERSASVRDVPRSPGDAHNSFKMPEYSDYEPILPNSKIVQKPRISKGTQRAMYDL